MPVWQSLYDELKSKNFALLSIALDTPDGARPHIEKARPTYDVLIDRDHHVAALYGMVNVPEAVWIDEDGRIVRPAENAGSYDAFRERDRATGALPADAAAKVRTAREVYAAAVRDWVEHGAASAYAMDADRAREGLRAQTEGMAQAQAHFVLGGFLARQGRTEEAQAQFERARALHPDSWAIWRQTAGRTAEGFAGLPDFWARVDALGERRYRERADMEGLP